MSSSGSVLGAHTGDELNFGPAAHVPTDAGLIAPIIAALTGINDILARLSNASLQRAGEYAAVSQEHIARQAEVTSDAIGARISRFERDTLATFAALDEAFTTGLLTVTGNSSFAGTLEGTDIILSGSLEALQMTSEGLVSVSHVAALSADDTSTFAGNLTVSGATELATTTIQGLLTVDGTASLTGSALIEGGLGIGIATTTPGVLETLGDARIGGDLLVAGHSIVLGNSTVLGASTADTLTINTSINSDLVPDLNTVRDLGSPAFFWNNAYVGTLHANSISAASTTISGTQSSSFTINSDNTSADTEDAHLIFFRGTVVPNAIISWDSSENRFDTNQSWFIQNASASDIPTLDLALRSGQTADIFRARTHAGAPLFSVSAAGAATLASAFTVTSGGITATGNSSFADALDVSGLATLATTTASSLTVAGGTRLEGALHDATNSAGSLGNLLTSTGTSTSWVSVSDALDDTYFKQGGNSFGAAAILGTNDSNLLQFETGGTTRMTIDTSGNVGVGTSTPLSRLSILHTSGSPQQRISYDATRFAELHVNALGELTLGASGGIVWLLDENFKLCAGGACPSFSDRISSAGNLLVEHTVVADRFEENCPAGYAWVPGLAKYGTLPGFCVMKYEAKSVGGVPTSEAAGLPWVSITQTNARAACEAIGPGYRLISDHEWMTMAEQIARLPINDIDDAAGLQLATGHSDSSSGRLASDDDEDPVVAGCNLMQPLSHASNAYSEGSCELRGDGINSKGYFGTGNEWSQTGYAAGGNNKSQLRTHVLPNGEVLWDIAGNVRSWTDAYLIERDTAGTGGGNDADGVTDEMVDAGGVTTRNWYQYTAVTSYGGAPHIRPFNPAWNNANGIGSIYINPGLAYDGSAHASDVHAFVRGGGWDYGASAGVFSLGLNSAPSSSDSGLGFRCAR